MKPCRVRAKARRRIVRAIMKELSAERCSDPLACLYYPDRHFDEHRLPTAVDDHLRWCRRFGYPLGRDYGPSGPRVVRSDTSECGPRSRTRLKRS